MDERNDPRRSDDEVLAKLGQRLAEERLRRNQTQSALAKLAGVSRATLQRLEAGHSTQVSNLVRVLRALQLPDLDQIAPPPSFHTLHQGPHRRRRASSKVPNAMTPWTGEPGNRSVEASEGLALPVDPRPPR